MTTEYASAGTLSGDATLPSVIRIFLYTDVEGRQRAAELVKSALADFVPESTPQVYEDVMPDVERSSSLADVWAEANPGADPGERARQRISIIVPGLSHAELADLSGPIADVVSPGWRSGHAAERAQSQGTVPCRVAVGIADEHPGEPPLEQN